MDNLRAINAPLQRMPVIPSECHGQLGGRAPFSHSAFSSRYPSAPHQPREYGPAQPFITGSNADGDSYRFTAPARLPKPAPGERVTAAEVAVVVSLFVIALALAICIVAEAAR